MQGQAIIILPWDWRVAQAAPGGDAATVLAAQQGRFNSIVDQALRALLPRMALYLNEANYAQRTCRRGVWAEPGTVAAVKRRFDASNLFYESCGVGSDAWASDADGRLYRMT
jgi:hypothetical protein